jgi:hypothetical protein
MYQIISHNSHEGPDEKEPHPGLNKTSVSTNTEKEESHRPSGPGLVPALLPHAGTENEKQGHHRNDSRNDKPENPLIHLDSHQSSCYGSYHGGNRQRKNFPKPKNSLGLKALNGHEVLQEYGHPICGVRHPHGKTKGIEERKGKKRSPSGHYIEKSRHDSRGKDSPIPPMVHKKSSLYCIRNIDDGKICTTLFFCDIITEKELFPFFRNRALPSGGETLFAYPLLIPPEKVRNFLRR